MPPSEMRRPLLPHLREADARLAEQPLSAAAEQRLQQLLAGGTPRRVGPRLAVVSGGLLTAAAIAIALLLWPRPATPPAANRIELAGFQVLEGQATAEDHTVRCGSARCALRAADEQVRLRLHRDARVRRRAGDVELVAGKLLCEVRPRPARRRPFRVLVSHGAIEVVGTRFAVEQRPRGGSVVLHHGAIRFIADSGAVVRLSPGERLVWPLPQAAPRPTAAAAPRPAAPPKPAAHAAPQPRAHATGRDGSAPPRAVESLLEEVERLRSQGRYAAAAARLRQGFEAADSEADRERLSYERGAILTDHLSDPRAACQHWTAHLTRFGRQRYGALIDKARAQLRCTGREDEGATR